MGTALVSGTNEGTKHNDETDDRCSSLEQSLTEFGDDIVAFFRRLKCQGVVVQDQDKPAAKTYFIGRKFGRPTSICKGKRPGPNPYRCEITLGRMSVIVK